MSGSDRYAYPTGGMETFSVTRSVHHRVIRPTGRVRPVHRRVRSSRQHSALSGELPRSCCWRRPDSAENFGGRLGRADEFAVNDRGGHHRAAIPRCRSISPRRRRMGRGASSRSNQSELSDTWPASHDGGRPSGSGRICGNGRETRIGSHARSDFPNSGRSQGEVNRHGVANDLPSAVDPAASKEKAKSKGRGKGKRRQSKEDRAPRVISDNNPRCGWLEGPARGTLPDDGLCIGRSKSVPGQQQGPLEGKRCFAPLPPKGCRILSEDDEFTLGEMASEASPRREINNSLLSVP